MQRRIRAATLTDIYGTGYQAPSERVLNISTLSGGLNLWDLDYRLSPDQSPDLLNVYWKDGSLSSRPGQEYVFDQEEASTAKGDFCACYEREWLSGYVIAHKGTKLYKINLTNGNHSELLTGLTKSSGTFFVYGDKLYYMNGHEYVQITTAGVASFVEPYIPIIAMNRNPAGYGGDLYQPENRIAAGKEVWFTADGTSKDYHLPYTSLDASPALTATVNGTAMTEGSGFTVNRTTGVVTFTTAPTQTSPEVPNNVKIVCYKSDSATMESVLACQVVTVFGEQGVQIVVCGGTPAQPNAYFWSGNHSFMDPTYFPVDNFNLAGANAAEYITGFGRQQSMLIIFKERSIGKAQLTVATVNEREVVNLPYFPINDNTGCDLPKSIRLIKNNLLFANTYSGIYCLLDTSAAGENNVKRLSRNVNGSGTEKGFYYDSRSVSASTITSYDDNQRYWLCANGKAYVLDYVIAGITTKEEKLSWFFFDNINARGWFHTVEDIYYFTDNGSLSKFVNVYSDYGEAIHRKYVFAASVFGTYEVLKDVLKVIFSVRSDTDTEMSILYRTDYERRYDLTPILAYAWRLVPRNLTHRSLRPVPFAMSFIRKPRCFHIRHFQMTLENNTNYTDMSVVSAQIIYRYSEEDR